MDAIQIMKDYMASGSFARGRDQVNADGSIVFVGNINDTVENILKVAHLFEPFPPEFNNDSAFFDRIHYYLPGWEVPKMRADYLTTEYGLITDCLAEFMREMRKLDFSHACDTWFRFNNCVTTRDEIAIRKTVSGLAKLVFPDKSYTQDEMEMLLIYAIEGRRRVKEQLKRMAGDEFSDVGLGFISNAGREIVVNVPEQSEDTLIPRDKLQPGHVFTIGASLSDGIPAVYKLENRTMRGTGKLEIQGIKGYGASAKLVKESLNAAWLYFIDNSKQVGRIERMMERDYLVYYDDPQNKFMSAEVSVAEFVGLCSTAFGIPVMTSTVILGELTLSGTVKEIKNLSDYIRVAVNAGAEMALMPQTSKEDFEAIRDVELLRITPLYYNTPVEAVRIVLEMD